MTEFWIGFMVGGTIVGFAAAAICRAKLRARKPRIHNW